MSSLKEIKERIESVRETRKITGAMYLISSSKLRRARESAANTRIYFDALRGEIKHIFKVSPSVESKYVNPRPDEIPDHLTHACIVITSDRGLVGSYNKNAVRRAEEACAEHTHLKFFPVGEYGRRALSERGYDVDEDFVFSGENPTLQLARKIAYYMLKLYDSGKIGRIFVIYSSFEGGAPKAFMPRLLPLNRTAYVPDGDEGASSEFEFFPTAKDVIDSMIPGYMVGFIYGALVESFSCEQQSRMMAMNAANRSADELLEELTRDYMRERQAAITEEITEIAAGSQPQGAGR
ncbi:MAG: ATP synthase F1 subunit gamma [Clostridia bacterium]|nr:ATP synthase F1 subunit gamma [Clostridia bacterium]